MDVKDKIWAPKKDSPPKVHDSFPWEMQIEMWFNNFEEDYRDRVFNGHEMWATKVLLESEELIDTYEHWSLFKLPHYCWSMLLFEVLVPAYIDAIDPSLATLASIYDDISQASYKLYVALQSLDIWHTENNDFRTEEKHSNEILNNLHLETNIERHILTLLAASTSLRWPIALRNEEYTDASDDLKAESFDSLWPKEVEKFSKEIKKKTKSTSDFYSNSLPELDPLFDFCNRVIPTFPHSNQVKFPLPENLTSLSGKSIAPRFLNSALDRLNGLTMTMSRDSKCLRDSNDNRIPSNSGYLFLPTKSWMLLAELLFDQKLTLRNCETIIKDKLRPLDDMP